MDANGVGHTGAVRPKSESIFLEVTFPTVSGAESAMEEQVGFFPGNLEADKPFARGNGLLALTTSDRCLPNHESPPPRLVALWASANPAAERNSSEAVEFPVGHAGELEPARKKWQWTGNPAS